jgi:hypothetical protein
LLELAEDSRRTKHHRGHDCIRIDARLECGLFALERAEVVTGSTQGRFAVLDAEEIYGSLAAALPRCRSSRNAPAIA